MTAQEMNDQSDKQTIRLLAPGLNLSMTCDKQTVEEIVSFVLANVQIQKPEETEAAHE